MIKQFKIRIGGTIDLNNPVKPSEPSDAPVLTAPSASPAAENSTMPVLSVDCSVNEELSTEIEVKKTSPPSGMFGSYDHGPAVGFNLGSSAASGSLPPRIPRIAPYTENQIWKKGVRLCNINQELKLGRGPHTPVSSSSMPIKSGISPSTLQHPQQQQQQQQQIILQMGTGKVGKLPSPAAKSSTAQTKKKTTKVPAPPSVAISVAVPPIIGNKDVVNKAKVAPTNLITETLVCHHEDYRCLHSVLPGSRFCLQHSKEDPNAGVLRCRYTDGQTVCNTNYLTSAHYKILDMCPKHALIIESQATLANGQHLRSWRFLDRVEAGLEKESNCKWTPRYWNFYYQLLCELQVIRPSKAKRRTVDGGGGLVGSEIVHPSDAARFDAFLHAGKATTSELLTALRDKYDELLECSAKLCTNVHHTMKLNRKMAIRNKLAPEAVTARQSWATRMAKEYSRPRHESALLHQLKERKRNREVTTAHQIGPCCQYMKTEQAAQNDSGQSGCQKAPLPFGQFCADHVLLDSRNSFFQKCPVDGCPNPCTLWDDHCSLHPTTSLDVRLKRFMLAKMECNAAEARASAYGIELYGDLAQNLANENVRRSSRLRERRLEYMYSDRCTLFDDPTDKFQFDRPRQSNALSNIRTSRRRPGANRTKKQRAVKVEVTESQPTNVASESTQVMEFDHECGATAATTTDQTGEGPKVKVEMDINMMEVCEVKVLPDGSTANLAQEVSSSNRIMADPPTPLMDAEMTAVVVKHEEAVTQLTTQTPDEV